MTAFRPIFRGYHRRMRVAAITGLLVGLVGCPQPRVAPGPEHDIDVVRDGAALATAPSPSAATAPSDAAVPSTLPSDLPPVVVAWNDATTKHDLAALAAVYGDEVTFYGADLVRADCVTKKADAFQRSPDSTQRIRDAKVMPDGNDGAYVTFTKDSTAEGKTTSVGGYVYVDRAQLIAEGDLPKTEAKDAWCQINTPDAWGVPTTNVVPPFRRSMLDVVGSVRASRYVADLKRTLKLDPIHVHFFACPGACTATSCEFDVELIAPQLRPRRGQFRGGRPTKVGQITLDLSRYALRTETGWEPF